MSAIANLFEIPTKNAAGTTVNAPNSALLNRTAKVYRANLFEIPTVTALSENVVMPNQALYARHRVPQPIIVQPAPPPVSVASAGFVGGG